MRWRCKIGLEAMSVLRPDRDRLLESDKTVLIQFDVFLQSLFEMEPSTLLDALAGFFRGRDVSSSRVTYSPVSAAPLKFAAKIAS